MYFKNEEKTFIAFTILLYIACNYIFRNIYASVASASSTFFFLVVRLRLGFSSAAATV